MLGTAMARPVIAEAQVAAARQANAQILSHGCTGKGNDQVRFEFTYGCLAPDLEIIAPWREWQFKGREDLLRYLAAKGIPVEATAEKPYSRDRNIWHCSHEGGILEDPEEAPPSDLFLLTTDPAEAPDEPLELTIQFEVGDPVAVDNVPMGPVGLVEHLNEIAGAHGIGRADVVEDRMIGMKSRGVYETPAGTVLRAAHRNLEQIVLDRRTLDLKDQLAPRYADLVYEGRWWTKEREVLDAAVAVTQQHVTGEVRLRLFKGSVGVLSRRSPYSMYSTAHATFEADDVFEHADAGAFIRLYGLQDRIASEKRSFETPRRMALA
jgi:argininosuccinate synthase